VSACSIMGTAMAMAMAIRKEKVNGKRVKGRRRDRHFIAFVSRLDWHFLRHSVAESYSTLNLCLLSFLSCQKASSLVGAVQFGGKVIVYLSHIRTEYVEPCSDSETFCRRLSTSAVCLLLAFLPSQLGGEREGVFSSISVFLLNFTCLLALAFALAFASCESLL